jgi:antitoxin VapB
MRGQSMIEATIYALEAAIRQEKERAPLAERLAKIAHDLRAKAGRNAGEMTRDEIDVMWGINLRPFSSYSFHFCKL